mmetsp:Transcript_22285/g.55736  ORF Transcript_22285/g.55736 Transcript_22285/m.55736 type:complete len:195 (-) Transcript_22285:326-910(-)
MAPVEAEIRRSRTASPGPHKPTASVSIPNDENARPIAIGNVQASKPAEEIVKPIPAKQQLSVKKEEQVKEEAAATPTPACIRRHRAFLIVTALFGSLSLIVFVVALVAGGSSNARVVGGAQLAAVTTVACSLAERLLTGVTSALHDTPPAEIAAAATAVFAAAGLTVAFVAVMQRRQRRLQGTSSVDEAKEKDA